MRRPVPAGRVTALCLVSLAAVAGPLVVGHAAALPVASQRLTTHTAASQVATTTCTAAVSADSFVSKGNPDTNYGTEGYLAVKADPSPSAADPRRSLVRADLSSCAIPTGAAVQSAQLALTIDSAPVASRVLSVHRAGSSWTEAGVTWTTQPTAGTATSSASTGTSPGVTIRWDVKADVAAFLAGTANEGWLVRDTVEGDLDIGVRFASREHATTSWRPALVITYYP